MQNRYKIVWIGNPQLCPACLGATLRETKAKMREFWAASGYYGRVRCLVFDGTEYLGSTWLVVGRA